MKIRFIRRIMAVCLTVATMMCTAVTAFAAETAEADNPHGLICETSVNGTKALRDTSVAGWVPSNGYADFYIDLPSYIGFTKKLYCCSSSTSTSGALFIYLYNPSGNLVSNDWILGVNEPSGEYWSLFLPSSGTYRIRVVASGTNADVVFGAWWQ